MQYFCGKTFAQPCFSFILFLKPTGNFKNRRRLEGNPYSVRVKLQLRQPDTTHGSFHKDGCLIHVM